MHDFSVNNKGFTLLETALVVLLAMIITAYLLPLVAAHQRNAICKSFGDEITSVVNAAATYYNIYYTFPNDGVELMEKGFLGDKFSLWGIYNFIYDDINRSNQHYFILEIEGTEDLKNASLLNDEIELGYCLSDNNPWVNFPVEYTGELYRITIPLKVVDGHIDLTGLSDKTFLYGEIYDFVKNECVISNVAEVGCETIGIWDTVYDGINSGIYKDPSDATVYYRTIDDYQRGLPPRDQVEAYIDPDSELYNGW